MIAETRHDLVFLDLSLRQVRAGKAVENTDTGTKEVQNDPPIHMMERRFLEKIENTRHRGMVVAIGTRS